jgi:hypothetical protein
MSGEMDGTMATSEGTGGNLDMAATLTPLEGEELCDMDTTFAAATRNMAVERAKSRGPEYVEELRRLDHEGMVLGKDELSDWEKFVECIRIKNALDGIERNGMLS